MEHHTWSGRIDYIHDEMGERGREFFTVTTHQDGRRVIRARCEIDDSEILRDVTYAMQGFTPEESYIRVVIKGQLKGSSWFTFADGQSNCEALMTDAGRVSQTVKTDGWGSGFIAHPVLCDCFLASLHREADATQIQWITGVLTSSQSPDGSTGPMLGQMELGVELIGDEEITVPAGTFMTRHYRYHLDHRGQAPAELWAMPGSNQLVKIYWSVLKSSYVLAELNGDPR